MATDKSERFEGSEYTTLGYAPRDRFVYLQHHSPLPEESYGHFHPSVEVNFLSDCDMTYSFSGRETLIRRNRFCVFWAANPHRVKDVQGTGLITNIYVNLPEFMKWPLPNEFVGVILSGAVICAKEELGGDAELAARWARETDNHSEVWQRLHASELFARLNRLAVEGWDVLLPPTNDPKAPSIGGNSIIQFEKMLRFIASNFGNPIKIRDVADEAGVSERYAITLFRRMLGRSIKEHINDTRMINAKLLLAESDLKILTIALDSGFPSLSAFYRAFQKDTGLSPDAFRNVSGNEMAASRC